MSYLISQEHYNVSNYTGLANIIPKGLSASIVVDGYTTPGDGGGGVFCWDTTSTSGGNNYTIVVPTGSTTGRWKMISVAILDGISISGNALDGYLLTATSSSAATWGGPIFDNPTIYGQTSWFPILNAPANTAAVYSQLFTGQTSTLDGYQNIQVGNNIPQCGKTAVIGMPTPPTNGTLRIDYEVDIAGTTTAIGAFFKGNWGFATHGATTNNMGSAPASLQSVGTNAGSPPTNWNATLQVISGQVQLVITTDLLDTYTIKATLQWGYTL